jgi:hypothetical protein
MNYFEQNEYGLEKVTFQFQEVIYSGRGLLTWDPSKGFHLDAFVEEKSGKLNYPISFGGQAFFIKEETICIKIKSNGFDHAIIPFALIKDHIELFFEKRLSYNANRMIFFNRYKNIKHDKSRLAGSVIFKTNQNPVLSDQNVEMDGDKIKSFKYVINHTDSNHTIWGEYTNDNILSVNYYLSSNIWSRKQCWEWGNAARLSLSILTGQEIQLMMRSVARGAQNIEELRFNKPEVHSLGILSPFGHDGFLDRELLVDLIELFLLNSKNAQICENVFRKICIASQQKSFQAKELLLSTILEAVLRTLDGYPFKPNDHSWNIRNSLGKFCKTYLSDKWKETCDNVIEIRKRLRHKNAHPDWLFDEGGQYSKEEISKSLHDMVFLTRFYGYMILSLVHGNVNDVEPFFPQPNDKGKPLSSISITTDTPDGKGKSEVS